MMGLIYDVVMEYFDLCYTDDHHRYRSWEHCYNHFRQRNSFRSDADFDLAALHLAFYLASWGMYRGSSFLLQKDYKVHSYVVKALLQDKYEILWDVTPESLKYEDNLPDMVINAREEVAAVYSKNIVEVNGRNTEVNVTDTLATKIMLGTMGCIPAYDRYFIAGLRTMNFSHISFNIKSIQELFEFYYENIKEFEKIQDRIEAMGFRYPMMKLLDMFFWQVGFNAEEKRKQVSPLNRKENSLNTNSGNVNFNIESPTPSVISMVIGLINEWQGGTITFKGNS